MNDEVKKYLHDIYKAILQIEEYIGNEKVFERFRTNRMLKQAVERNIEIIGEAMNKALQLEFALEVTSGRKIVNIRNLLIHAYDSVDDTRVWEIIVVHIPLLKKEIEKLLKD